MMPRELPSGNRVRNGDVEWQKTIQMQVLLQISPEFQFAKRYFDADFPRRRCTHVNRVAARHTLPSGLGQPVAGRQPPQQNVGIQEEAQSRSPANIFSIWSSTASNPALILIFPFIEPGFRTGGV